MHDIGKIGILDSILLESGKLDEFEWDVMTKHTIYGTKMLGEDSLFSTEKYRLYFNAQSWYYPISKNVTLNDIEEYNVYLIKAEEDRRGIVN